MAFASFPKSQKNAKYFFDIFALMRYIRLCEKGGEMRKGVSFHRRLSLTPKTCSRIVQTA
jgi:hypothetical protein